MGKVERRWPGGWFWETLPAIAAGFASLIVGPLVDPNTRSSAHLTAAGAGAALPARPASSWLAGDPAPAACGATGAST
jgi:hypothetical protein